MSRKLRRQIIGTVSRFFDLQSNADLLTTEELETINFIIAKAVTREEDFHKSTAFGKMNMHITERDERISELEQAIKAGLKAGFYPEIKEHLRSVLLSSS